MVEAPFISEPKKFFISFKEDSGRDFAVHLYKSLIKKGVDVFISCHSLEFDASRGPWRDQIDNALDQTKVFILIVTHTATTSAEIVRELEQAITNDAEKYYFIIEDLSENQHHTTFRLSNGNIFKIKDFQTKTFRNENDLVRKVCSTIPLIEEIEFCDEFYSSA